MEKKKNLPSPENYNKKAGSQTDQKLKMVNKEQCQIQNKVYTDIATEELIKSIQ